MFVNTMAGQIPQLLYSNGQLASRDLVFLDFLGLCSKRTRRRVGIASSNRLTRGAVLRKNWSSLSIRAVIDLERIGTSSKSFFDDIKPQYHSFFSFYMAKKRRTESQQAYGTT